MVGAWAELVAGEVVVEVAVVVGIRSWLQVMGILAVICSMGSNLAGFGYEISIWCSMVGLGVWFGVSMVFQR